MCPHVVDFSIIVYCCLLFVCPVAVELGGVQGILRFVSDRLLASGEASVNVRLEDGACSVPSCVVVFFLGFLPVDWRQTREIDLCDYSVRVFSHIVEILSGKSVKCSKFELVQMILFCAQYLLPEALQSALEDIYVNSIRYVMVAEPLIVAVRTFSGRVSHHSIFSKIIGVIPWRFSLISDSKSFRLFPLDVLVTILTMCNFQGDWSVKSETGLFDIALKYISDNKWGFWMEEVRKILAVILLRFVNPARYIGTSFEALVRELMANQGDVQPRLGDIDIHPLEIEHLSITPLGLGGVTSCVPVKGGFLLVAGGYLYTRLGGELSLPIRCMDEIKVCSDFFVLRDTSGEYSIIDKRVDLEASRTLLPGLRIVHVVSDFFHGCCCALVVNSDGTYDYLIVKNACDGGRVHAIAKDVPCGDRCVFVSANERAIIASTDASNRRVSIITSFYCHAVGMVTSRVVGNRILGLLQYGKSSKFVVLHENGATVLDVDDSAFISHIGYKSPGDPFCALIDDYLVVGYSTSSGSLGKKRDCSGNKKDEEPMDNFFEIFDTLTGILVKSFKRPCEVGVICSIQKCVTKDSGVFLQILVDGCKLYEYGLKLLK